MNKTKILTSSIVLSLIFASMFIFIPKCMSNKDNSSQDKTIKGSYGFVIENRTKETSKTGIGWQIEVTIDGQAPFILSPNSKDEKEMEYESSKFVETLDAKPITITWKEIYKAEPNKEEIMPEIGFCHRIKDFQPKFFDKKPEASLNRQASRQDSDVLIHNDGGFTNKTDKQNPDKIQLAMPQPLVQEKDFQGYFTLPDIKKMSPEKTQEMLKFAITALRDKAREANLSVPEKVLFDYMVEKFFTGSSWVEKAKPNPSKK